MQKLTSSYYEVRFFDGTDDATVVDGDCGAMNFSDNWLSSALVAKDDLFASYPEIYAVKIVKFPCSKDNEIIGGSIDVRIYYRTTRADYEKMLSERFGYTD